jgi:hypothetical protein
MIVANRVNLSIKVDAHVVAFPAKKNPPAEANFGMVVRCPINAFCTTATNDAACLQCLVPLVAETAEACGQTMQLACNVLCPCWPRLLGLVVKRNLPAMSSALVGRDCWGLLYIRLACPQS